MARVEKDPRFEDQQKQQRQSDAVDRTPGKAEGDEETVERALEKDDEEPS